MRRHLRPKTETVPLFDGFLTVILVAAVLPVVLGIALLMFAAEALSARSC